MEYTPQERSKAPLRVEEPDVPFLVTQTVKMIGAEADNLKPLTVSRCESRIQELLACVQPAAETRTSLLVLGQLVLLYHHKSQLQAQEHARQLSQLQSRLQVAECDKSWLVTEARTVKEEALCARREIQTLRAQLMASQPSPTEWIYSEQGDQTSDLSDPFTFNPPQTSQVQAAVFPPSEVPKAQSTEDLRCHLVEEAELKATLQRNFKVAGPWEEDPLIPELQAESVTTPSPLQVSDLKDQDSFRAPLMTQLAEDRSVPPKRQSYLHELSGLDFGPPPSREPPAVPTKPVCHQPRLGPQQLQQLPLLLGRGLQRPQCPNLCQHTESDNSDGLCAPQKGGLRLRLLEFLARDIECFNPDRKDSNIDDYLREVERCLLDLPQPSDREKLKLVWRTTARSVHRFMQTLSPATRHSYPDLCRALQEEYSTYSNLVSAMEAALKTRQEKSEPPKQFYWRLRSAYFQGRNAPGLEEDPAFRALFLNNLHSDIQWFVNHQCRNNKMSVQEIRRFAQEVWSMKCPTHHNLEPLDAGADPALVRNEQSVIAPKTQKGRRRPQSPELSGTAKEIELPVTAPETRKGRRRPQSPELSGTAKEIELPVIAPETRKGRRRQRKGRYPRHPPVSSSMPQPQRNSPDRVKLKASSYAGHKLSREKQEIPKDAKSQEVVELLKRYLGKAVESVHSRNEQRLRLPDFWDILIGGDRLQSLVPDPCEDAEFSPQRTKFARQGDALRAASERPAAEAPRMSRAPPKHQSATSASQQSNKP
ncbi:uncharacterized protein V6R79_005962 [Siganus canaliculatus]